MCLPKPRYTNCGYEDIFKTFFGNTMRSSQMLGFQKIYWKLPNIWIEITSLLLIWLVQFFSHSENTCTHVQIKMCKYTCAQYNLTKYYLKYSRQYISHCMIISHWETVVFLFVSFFNKHQRLSKWCRWYKILCDHIRKKT